MLLDDVRAYLVAMGASSSAWPIYEGFLPDDRDQTIALFETGGYPAQELNRENEDVTFMFRVRAARLDYATARAKWQELFDLLQDAQHTGSLLMGYAFIQALHQGPLPFTDDKGRINMTGNFKVKKTRS